MMAAADRRPVQRESATVDCRHEAIKSLHKAMLAIEAGCFHQAETHTLSAVAWLRNVTQAQSLDDLDVSPEPVWQYRP